MASRWHQGLRVRAWASMAFALCPLCLASPSDAAPKGAPPAGAASKAAAPRDAEATAAQKETARTLMDAGRLKERRRDLEGALEAYLAADKLMGVPSTGLSLGRVYAALGKLVEARDVLLRVARYPVEPGEPRPFALGRRQAAQLEAALAPRIPSLQLTIENDPLPPGLTVRIDETEVPVEALAFPIKVNPGQRRVVLSADGFLPFEQQVEVEERKSAQLQARLVIDPEAAKPARAAPVAMPTDEVSDGGLSPVVWVGFGVAGAALIVGVVTGALAMSKSSQLEEACPEKHCPPEREADLDSMTALSHTSTVTFVLAGVGAAVGLVALFALSGEGDAVGEVEGGDGDGSVDDGAASEPRGDDAVTVSLAVGLGTVGLLGRF